MRTGNKLSGQSASDRPECAGNRLVVGSSRKPSETSHTGWVKFEESRASSSFQVRSVIRRVNCSGALKPKTCFEGRSIEAIAAASIYGACRCNGHCGYSTTSLTRHALNNRVANAYKTLNTELGLPTQPVRPSEFIPVSRRNSIFQHTSDSELVGWLNSRNRQEWHRV